MVFEEEIRRAEKIPGVVVIFAQWLDLQHCRICQGSKFNRRNLRQRTKTIENYSKTKVPTKRAMQNELELAEFIKVQTMLHDVSGDTESFARIACGQISAEAGVVQNVEPCPVC